MSIPRLTSHYLPSIFSITGKEWKHFHSKCFCMIYLSAASYLKRSPIACWHCAEPCKLHGCEASSCPGRLMVFWCWGPPLHAPQLQCGQHLPCRLLHITTTSGLLLFTSILFPYNKGGKEQGPQSQNYSLSQWDSQTCSALCKHVRALSQCWRSKHDRNSRRDTVCHVLKEGHWYRGWWFCPHGLLGSDPAKQLCTCLVGSTRGITETSPCHWMSILCIATCKCTHGHQV